MKKLLGLALVAAVSTSAFAVEKRSRSFEKVETSSDVMTYVEAARAQRTNLSEYQGVVTHHIGRDNFVENHRPARESFLNRILNPGTVDAGNGIGGSRSFLIEQCSVAVVEVVDNYVTSTEEDGWGGTTTVDTYTGSTVYVDSWFGDLNTEDYVFETELIDTSLYSYGLDQYEVAAFWGESFDYESAYDVSYGGTYSAIARGFVVDPFTGYEELICDAVDTVSF